MAANVLDFDAGMRLRDGWRSVHLARKRRDDAAERARLARMGQAMLPAPDFSLDDERPIA